MSQNTRIVFMGTPDFAVPSLRALADEFNVVGVVTQPDRPAGRGSQLRQPPVKQAALESGLPVIQPMKVREESALQQLASWQPDIIAVAAFGQILPGSVLALPAQGCVNVHASLLPRWRGAAPIHYAIWHGDAQTGITIMLMDEGLDTGPMLSSRAVPIGPQDTLASMHDRLAELGAELLAETLPGYLSGDIKPQAQPEEGITLAPTLKKDAGHIDWAQTAAQIDQQVRAFDPWPGTFTFFGDERLKILSGYAVVGPQVNEPGTVINVDGEIRLVTGEGYYALDHIQPPGKKAMAASAFANGRPDFIDSRLG